MRGDAQNPADWLAYARRDLAKAKSDLDAGEVPYALTWLQQAAEKALKSWLIARGWNLVKTHDVASLARAAIQRGADVSWFLPTASAVTEEYFAERYPGDFDPPPTHEEARRFLADVQTLFAQLHPNTGPNPK
ncbi:MAG: HEPN domain-containing protein [Verrucomicrobiota bacterium]